MSKKRKVCDVDLELGIVETDESINESVDNTEAEIVEPTEESVIEALVEPEVKEAKTLVKVIQTNSKYITVSVCEFGFALSVEKFPELTGICKGQDICIVFTGDIQNGTFRIIKASPAKE